MLLRWSSSLTQSFLTLLCLRSLGQAGELRRYDMRVGCYVIDESRETALDSSSRYGYGRVIAS
jgi:hypothetical protein